MTESVSYQKELQEVGKRLHVRGEKMQPACSPSQLAQLREECKNELGVDLPEPYARFLQLHNGLDWNEMVIYAAEKTPIASHPDLTIAGCVEVNLMRRDFPEWKRFFILGGTGASDYCLDLVQSRYCVVDPVSLYVYETFPSFDAMVADLLRRFC